MPSASSAMDNGSMPGSIKGALAPMRSPLDRWDIFCRVIDNFGDAGVAWRLARQLAGEHGLDVTLWIDWLAALKAMVPGLDVEASRQSITQVTIRRLDALSPLHLPAAVVIDALGGGLPDGYISAMASHHPPPQWFVLEYLSAEPWVETVHALPSTHPSSGLARTFWWPGFTQRTGGLLRERDVLRCRDAFLNDSDAATCFWQGLQIPVPTPGTLRISLFCYPNAPIGALFDRWAAGQQPIACMVPSGVAPDAIARWSEHGLKPGLATTRGQLTVHVIPFLPQEGYDTLLWACDVNFVRGEDSFVRAQWAGKPFVWHAYPQENGAHRAKVRAFLDRYTATLEPSVAAAVDTLWNAWNGLDCNPCLSDAWHAFSCITPQLATRAALWAADLAILPDLAGGLVAAAHTKV